MGHTGQGSADPGPMYPETNGSPGRVSLQLAIICTEPPSPVQVCLDLTNTSGNHSAESLEEVCTLSMVQADGPHTLMEPLEPAFLGSSCPSPSPSLLDSSSATDISSLQALMLARSTSSGLDSALELHSEGDPPAELLDQLEPPEPPEEELQAAGPAPAYAQVAPAELVPVPPAAPSSARAPQQEPEPASPSPPAADLQLPEAPQQGSALQLYLWATLDPHLPFPCLVDLLCIVSLAILINQSYVNDRI
ncbi:PREDICTED: amyloid beta A4 precursor protein-binding family B member 1-interacting protein-like isoform X2 [Chinchilla lanigera]|nr:PREDICTED: amyloid beta A4 precursor protein-binding family B member 1-interacting protein-like isoform X2 [Chinchilla lanigera]